MCRTQIDDRTTDGSKHVFDVRGSRRGSSELREGRFAPSDLRRLSREGTRDAKGLHASSLGDELLQDASGMSTRAVDIDAPASAVWPWLAQIGPSPRGGAYTYDWIENLLRLNMHSVDRVLPEFQHPDVGETMSLGSRSMRVERVESERVLAWRSEDENWVWTLVLSEHDGRTRLISRNRFRLPTLVARIGMVPMEPGSLVMERKMLLSIKERAERLASTDPERPSPALT